MNRRIIRRDRILNYVAQCESRVISMVAPAGFGKSTLAGQIAAETENWTLCDAAATSNAFEFAGRILEALQKEANALSGDSIPHLQADMPAAQLEGFVVDAWLAGDLEGTWIFDNLEAIADQPQSLALLAGLVSSASRRKLILCSRPPFSLLSSRLIPPNEHLRLTLEDLAFTRGEVGAILGDLDAERLDNIAAVTQGWPVAVFLMRQVASTGRLDRVLGVGTDAAYLLEDISDYLIDEVIKSIDAPQFEVLLAIVATRRAAKDAVFRSDPELATTTSLEGLERQFPLVHSSGDGRYVVHPLIVSLLEAVNAFAIERLRVTAAESYQRDGLLVEAAQLYFDAGRIETGADCLEQALGSYLEPNPFEGINELAGQLPPAVRAKCPRLWARLAYVRRVVVPLGVIVAEGTTLRESLRSSPSSLEAREVDAVLITLATQLGDNDFAESILSGHSIDEDSLGPGEAEIVLAATIRAVSTGRTTGALERYERLLPLIHNDLLRAHFILRVEAAIATMCGHFEDALLALERARTLTLTGGGGLSADIAQEATVVAWLAGDDVAVEAFFEEIRRAGAAIVPLEVQAIGDAWQSGSIDRLNQDESPRRRAFALLLMAAKVPQGDRRRTLLEEAERAANVAEDLWTRLLVTVARAVTETTARETLLQDALSLAQRTGRPELVASVTSLQGAGAGYPALAALASHFASQSLSAKVEVVRINALSATIFRGSRRLNVSNRVLSLMLILAVLKRARRETISELLWGEGAADSGVYALKVLVSRARKQLEDPTIIVVENKYCSLRPNVIVDLDDIHHCLRALPSSDRLTDAERRPLQGAYGQFLEIPWTDNGDAVPSIEAVITRTRQQVIERLAKDALARGEIELVIELAEKLRQIDCDDEAASELLIRAFTTSGNRTEAMREYRAYSDRIKRLFAVEPSFSINELLIVKPAS